MKLGDALALAASELRENGIEDNANEAAVLLCYLLGTDRASLYARPERELSPGEITAFDALVARRCSGEPSSYIRQSREFYGIEFYVDQRVLVPRPETETLVDVVIKFTKSRTRNPDDPWLVADVGTGSGAIAVALAGQIPHCRVYALDISPQALEVAAINIQRQGLSDKIALLQGNLLEPLGHRVDIIAANLPYIRADELATLQREVSRHEPELALTGGVCGSELVIELITQAKDKLSPGGAVFLEIGSGQQDELIEHARSVFSQANVSLTADYAGVGRVISIVT